GSARSCAARVGTPVYTAPPSVSHASTKWVSPANAKVTEPFLRLATVDGDGLDGEGLVTGLDEAGAGAAPLATLVQPVARDPARAGTPIPAVRSICRRVNWRGLISTRTLDRPNGTEPCPLASRHYCWPDRRAGMDRPEPRFPPDSTRTPLVR